MSYYIEVKLPYGEMSLDPEATAEQILVLDSSSKGRLNRPDILRPHSSDVDGFSEDELKRIIISAALLLSRDAGTVAECLDTAIIWERG